MKWNIGLPLITVLRLSVLSMLFCCLMGLHPVVPQTSLFSLHMENVTIREVLNEIEERTDYAFLFPFELTGIFNETRVSVDVANSTVEEALAQIMPPAGVEYVINDRQVLIRARVQQAAPVVMTQQPVSVTVNGTVVDAGGNSLPGVSIRLKGTNTGTAAGADGTFSIALPAGVQNPVLEFSFVGMKTQEVPVVVQGSVSTASLRVVMEEDTAEMGELVVEAGIIQRDRLGFTGSYSTFSAQELKSIGNLNPIQALKTLDPSFIVADNLIDGSNPNVMANIQVRGQTSMSVTSLSEEASTASSQPLFIKDGFEISLAEFNDIDINRIESITILKDAGSTAIYGSKGANGVIVIETIKPKQGQVFISYGADVQFVFPDLSVYNLMNAAEKLEFEKLARRWGRIQDDYNPTGQAEYDRRLELVQSGVDTDWLAEPVRNAITNNHSVTLSGGEKDLLFDVGISYRNNQGVMKESARETYGGNVRLVYRGLNKLNISNNMIVSGVNAADGSWGKFSDFAKAIPYFPKMNEDGTLPKFLDSYRTSAVSGRDPETRYAYNPLYNAMLNTYTNDRSFYFTNNTAVDWYVSNSFRVKASFSIKKTSGDYQNFKDPRHTDFEDTNFTKKGYYRGSKNNSWSYEGNTTFTYTTFLAEHHNVTAIVRGSAKEALTRSETLEAEGFPEGSKGYPSNAYSYKEGVGPIYSEILSRDVSFLGAFNYNYKYRYLFDVNYSIDGSTAFGSNKKFQDFWSAGIGWNITREEFASDWRWMSDAKITATIGTNANQNNNFVTSSVYTYYPGSTQFGTGSHLSQFANPDLEWQQTRKKSLSFESGFLNNRMKLTLGLYDHRTDPLIAILSQKPSSGTGTYPFNMGYLDSRGVEFTALYYLIYNMERNIMFSIRLTGAHGREKYGGYGTALDRLNDSYLAEANSTNLLSIQKFEDGRSPSDLWAVPSLGIDPATGKEVFLTKDGQPTFIYNPDDRVVVGNTKPDMEGVVGLNLILKKLQVNANFRYRFGGDALNTALYNKVENITFSSFLYNQDKRALYDRWRRAGDIAQFVSISSFSANSWSGNPLSGRFVQEDNQLILESARITWDFSNDKWVKALRMKDLKAGVSMNDVFRVSSIKMERGIDYPFARSFAFNLTARF